MTDVEFGQAPVTPEYWFLEAPLYYADNYQFSDEELGGFDNYRSNLIDVIFPSITIDVYCPSCTRETVFRPIERKIDWYQENKSVTRLAPIPCVMSGVHYAHFRCSRDQCNSHLYYVFTIADGVLTKIGQFPSIADLLSPAIKKYSSVLDREQIAAWQRAIGLRAHGIGAGSYVYLRRIIEQMVNEAYDTAMKESAIEEKVYVSSRWPEKIKLLASYLPQFLVDNAKVYGVLSKGVHELTEEECANYFDVMHTSIEIMCDEKLAKQEREKKSSDGAKALQSVFRSISRTNASASKRRQIASNDEPSNSEQPKDDG